MSSNIIEVKSVTKTYRVYDKPMDRLKESLSPTRKEYGASFNALEDINFKIKKGENIGIVGTNGSGKSTILKIITGVLNANKGSVVVNGKISALLELGTGFNMEYTGIENIYLNGTMMGLSRESITSKIPEIIAFADIGDFVNRPVKTYSSGMFARLAFAVAINVEPDILIVDEVLSVGDTRFQLKCMKKMKDMMKGGTTVIFVSHDVNSIKRFCSRAIWIQNGKMIADGVVDDVTDDYLDYLKKADVPKSETKEIKDDEKPFQPGDNIAEIINVKLKNTWDEEVTEIELNKPLQIEVTYDVYDENIEKPVLGVAIRSMDEVYICGLNTAIDNINIPWNYGRNKVNLEYTYGMLTIGGKYYFDVALMDETASVNIQYLAKAKEILIKSKYVGEGHLIIPHTWRVEHE